MPLFGPPNFDKLKKKGKTKELIYYLGSYHNPEIQRSATLALGQMGPIAIEPLMVALEGNDMDTRSNAADALGMIGDTRIIAPLLASFDDGKGASSKYPSSQWDYQRNDSPKKRAIVNLGPAAIEPLVTALKEGNNSIRFHAAEILGRIGNPRAIPALAAILNDQDCEIREMATIALGQIGGSDVVEPLITALQDPGDPVKITAAKKQGYRGKRIIYGFHVRKAAAEALGRIGDRRAIEPLSHALAVDDGEVLRTVASSLDSFGWNPEGHTNAAWYWVAKNNWEKCLEIGNPAKEALILVLREDGWKGVAPYKGKNHSHLFAAIDMIGKIGDEAAVELLIFRLNNEGQEKSIRCAAAEALGHIGGSRAIEALYNTLGVYGMHDAAKSALDSLERIPLDDALGNLQSKNPDLQLQAIAVIAVSRDPRGVEPVIALIDEKPSVEILRAAIKALGRIGDSRAVEPCISLLQDSEHDICRIDAIEVLQTIKDDRCILPLIDVILKDKDAYIRKRAVIALGIIGNDIALGPVAHILLTDPDYSVRQEAAKTLGQFGNTSAITPLSHALNDKDYHVKNAAVEALGKIGDIQALELLIKALKDPYPDTRKAAAQTLVKINDLRTKDLLVKEFNEENSYMRQQALEAFKDINNKNASEPLMQILR